MTHWLTTHWPPRTDAPDNLASGVWLADGRESAGKDVSAGDLVLVYQARRGRTRIVRDIAGQEKRIPRLEGKEGIVAIAQVSAPFVDCEDSEAEDYVDGSRIWWRWYAAVNLLSRSGFVARIRVNKVLGYKPAYNYRGFGTAHSGLAPLTQQQYKSLTAEFLRGNPIDLPELPVLPQFRSGPGGSGIESTSHLALKLFVAKQPVEALGEAGLRTETVEYPFPTGDCADVILSDSVGRIIGLEIEVGVGDNDWEGPLQAIKYRRMLEPLTARRAGDSRSILVAYEISDSMRKKCAAYGVECFVISRSVVAAWYAANS
jgi:hypothetical protein